MWHAGSSSSQTGPGEASWDGGSVPGNKRVISSLPSSPLSSRSLTPRVCLPSNTIISPDGCRSAMRACQGTLQYSWWKLLMFSVMMWKRYIPDLSIDCSFIWICQSTNASPPDDGSSQQFFKRLLKKSTISFLSCKTQVEFNERFDQDELHLITPLSYRGSADEHFQALRYQTNLLPKDDWSDALCHLLLLLNVELKDDGWRPADWWCARRCVPVWEAISSQPSFSLSETN